MNVWSFLYVISFCCVLVAWRLLLSFSSFVCCKHKDWWTVVGCCCCCWLPRGLKQQMCVWCQTCVWCAWLEGLIHSQGSRLVSGLDGLGFDCNHCFFSLSLLSTTTSNRRRLVCFVFGTMTTTTRCCPLTTKMTAAMQMQMPFLPWRVSFPVRTPDPLKIAKHPLSCCSIMTRQAKASKLKSKSSFDNFSANPRRATTMQTHTSQTRLSVIALFNWIGSTSEGYWLHMIVSCWHFVMCFCTYIYIEFVACYCPIHVNAQPFVHALNAKVAGSIHFQQIRQDNKQWWR